MIGFELGKPSLAFTFGISFILNKYHHILLCYLFLELVGGPLDGRYVLEQFHCHWAETSDKGSEHTMNGKTYAGEVFFKN